METSVPYDVWKSSSDHEESLSDSSSEDSDSDYRDSDQEGRRQEITPEEPRTRTLRTLENRGRTRRREHGLQRENKIASRSSRNSDLSAAEESDDSDFQFLEGPIRDTGRGSKTDRHISATFPHQGEDDRHEGEKDNINGVRRENQGSLNRRKEVYSNDDAQIPREWLPGRQNTQGLAEENRSPYRQAQTKQTSSNRQANHTGTVTIAIQSSSRRALNESGNGEGSSRSAENCQSRSPLKRKGTESAGDTCDYDYSDNKRRMREPAESPLNATSSSSPTNYSHQNRCEPCTAEHQPRKQSSICTPSSVNSQWTFQPVALPEQSAMDIENYYLDSDNFAATSLRFSHQGDEGDWHEDKRDHINGVRRGRQNAQSLAEEIHSPYRQAQSKQTSSNRQANHTGTVTIDVENGTRRTLSESGNGEGSSRSAENCQSRSPLKRKGTESAGDTCDYDYSDNKRRMREPAESPLNVTSSSSPTNSSHQNRREPCTTELQLRNQSSNCTPSSVNSQLRFQPVALPEHSAMDTENYHLDCDYSIELGESPEGTDMTPSSVYDSSSYCKSASQFLSIADKSWTQVSLNPSIARHVSLYRDLHARFCIYPMTDGRRCL